MSMSTGGGAGKVQADINVTPMVDIMLVLLIIFMVVTPLLQSGVTVIIPKGDNPDEDANITKDSAVVISIPSDGVYYVGRDQVRDDRIVDTVRNRMKDLKPSDPQIVYIKGGVNVQYGDVVKVVNMIRDAGYEQLGLVADKNKAGQQ
jgi:biopolymer transport protein TolR